MENKLTALIVLGFLGLAGLSVESVNGLPVNMQKEVTTPTSASAPQPTRDQIDFILKVTAVYHEGKVKKLMSYVRYAPPPLNFTGTPPQLIQLQITPPKQRLSEKVPQLPKYTEWFHRIPSPSLPSSILTTASDTTCQNKNDFLWLPTAKIYDILVPPKNVKSYTPLLIQCDPNHYPISVDPSTPTKFWQLDGGIPLYTIYVGVGTPNQTMTINLLVNFNLPSFLQNFPLDLISIKSVVIRVALYSDSDEKGSLKETLRKKKYFIQEDEESVISSSDSNCFMVFLKKNHFCESSTTFHCRYSLYIYIGAWLALVFLYYACIIIRVAYNRGNEGAEQVPFLRRRSGGQH